MAEVIELQKLKVSNFLISIFLLLHGLVSVGAGGSAVVVSGSNYCSCNISSGEAERDERSATSLACCSLLPR